LAKKESKPIITCPRCGKPGYGPYLKDIGGGRKYYYIAHRFKDSSGKWKTKWCYIPQPKEKPKELELPKKEKELPEKLEVAEGLLEVFKDFDIVIEGKSQSGKYKALYQVIPKSEKKTITLEDLENYVKRLNEKYPEEGFKIEKRGKYIVLTKKLKLPTEEEREKLQQLHKQLEVENREIGRIEGLITHVNGLIREIEREIRKFEGGGPLSFIIKLFWRREYLELKAKRVALEKMIPKYQEQLEAKRKLVDEIRKQLSENENSIGRVDKGVDIYFDLTGQKVYVPRYYIEKTPKLANYILFRTLGALGLTTTRYLKTCGKVDSKVN